MTNSRVACRSIAFVVTGVGGRAHCALDNLEYGATQTAVVKANDISHHTSRLPSKPFQAGFDLAHCPPTLEMVKRSAEASALMGALKDHGQWSSQKRVCKCSASARRAKQAAGAMKDSGDCRGRDPCTGRSTRPTHLLSCHRTAGVGSCQQTGLCTNSTIACQP